MGLARQAGAGPARAAVLVVLSAALMSGVSWGRYVLLRHPAPDHLRLGTPLALAALALVLLALAGAFAGWRALLREAGTVPLRVLLAAAAGAAVAAAPMLPLLSNDVFSVLAYADLAWNSTVSPFTLPPPGLKASRFYALVSPAWNWTPCVYGPLQLVVWAPALAGQALGAVLLAKLVALGLHLALLGLMLVYARRLPEGERSRAFALAALSPVLWAEGAGQAHGDLLCAVLIAAWLLLAARGWALLAGLAIGLAVASKASALAVAGMYGVHLLAQGEGGPARRIARAAAAGAGMAAAVLLAYEPVWTGTWTLVVPMKALGYRWPAHTFFEVLFQALQPLGSRPRDLLPPINAVATALSAGVALLGIVAAARARTVPHLAAAAFGILGLSLTLTAPVFHAWYLVVCAPLALELRDPSWRRWFTWSAGLGTALGASALFDWGGLAHDLYRVATVTWACVLSVWLLPARLRALWPFRQDPGEELRAAV